MAFDIDVSNEWKYIGNTQSVTLFRRSSDAGGYDGGTSVPNAFSPGYIRDLVTGKAVTAKDDNTFVLWQAQTGNPAPKQLDVIQDENGVRWSVVKVQVQAWGWRFVCDAVRER